MSNTIWQNKCYHKQSWSLANMLNFTRSSNAKCYEWCRITFCIIHIWFWSNIIDMIFGRPLGFTLCYQTLSVCLSVLSVCPVCDVGVLWPNRWIKTKLGRSHPAPSPPPPEKGKGHSSPNFCPCIVAKRLHGSRWHLVRRLAWVQATLCYRGIQPAPWKGAQQPLNFWPMSVVAKRLDGSRRHLVGR